MTIMVVPVQTFANDNSGTVKGEEVEFSLSNSFTGSARKNNFNKDWKFYLGTSSSAHSKNFDDSAWSDVDLPHDFSITQSFTTSGEAESGFLPGGTGWYRKTFTMPAETEGKISLLNFDGVYMHAYVYVNGNFVGEHHYGYTAFAVDITDYLICDGVTENVIAVKAVNNIPSSRWYSGSGLYRDVSLIVTDPIHVDWNGTCVTTPNISNGDGTVQIEADIVNDGSMDVSVDVTNTIYAKGSDSPLAEKSSSVTIEAGSTVTVTNAPVVSSPVLWSVDSPNLYTVVTEVSVDGTVVDTYETEFGFRWFTFSNSGFALNGKNVKLNGVCMHHDQGALGSAAYYDAMYRQLSIMKDMGCNAIRTAHNPADEQFIEICNELGLLVIEEAFDGLNEAKNGNSNDFSSYFETSVDSGLYGASSNMTCAEYAARSMVKRDRNAPSIIAWSFGNEIQEGTNWVNIGQFDTFCQSFVTWVNGEDGSRPITIGDNNKASATAIQDVLNVIIENDGIVGFNYANSASTLYDLLQSWGGNSNCIIASETSSHVNSRGIYTSQSSAANADGKYHLTSYDTSAVTWGINAHDSIYNTYQYDGVAGEFVWTGFDYIGEPTPWNGTGTGSVSGGGAIPNSSYFGAVDTAGFEKDTFYLYRSQWNKNDTTVHLVTAWDSDNYMVSGNTTPVWLYSNAAKVELYLNDSLIATSTREAVTSDAGHTYYTYSSVTNNASVCTVSNGSGADALYGAYNIVYTSGVLTAKAYDENGTEINLDDSCGRYTVTTPDAASKLIVSQNKTTAAADGSSLIYISVDVADANGNLDTTATNNIVFSLSGNGEIVGVDNGDQATTKKYQQSSALTSTTSANIDAYAGKALAIVRTSEDAGTISINVTSDGLVGGSAIVTTTAVSDVQTDGLVSYTMVKDYSVKVGTEPEFETTAAGTLTDGTTIEGTITWDPVNEVYNEAGDYTVNGILAFSGYDTIAVSAKLHVIPNVIAMRNVSTATTAGVVPEMPSIVNGVMADGTVTGEFTVVWDQIDADALTNIDDLVTVQGTATVLGNEILPVTCTIRVAQENQTESVNIAPQYLTLEQDISEANQSDVLTSITNGTTKPGDNTSERWTNWNNRTTSANATLTFTWATAHNINQVDLYYYYDNCCAYPEAVEFSYSLNGVDYIEIEASAEEVETYSLGARYSYTFAEVVNPVGLKIMLTQQNGTTGSNCVGLTEVEVYTYASALEYNASADLSGIAVDGETVADFSADTLNYEASGSAVTAFTNDNAGITILPVYDNVIRILTVSEDGVTEKTYEITVVCTHANTERQNVKTATCVENGYTGDIYCIDCQTMIKTGTEIPATGHDWGDGVVTKEATENENGIMTYTCANCSDTMAEEIVYAPELKIPSVSLSVGANQEGKLVMTGCVDDYDNLDDYYDITSHGLVYMQTKRLGSRVITVNTSGRTRVNFSTYKEDGSYVYRLTPASESTSYTVRAFIAYTDSETGRTICNYSDVVVGSCNSLS